MKLIVTFILLIILLFQIQTCFALIDKHNKEKVYIIRVPADYPSIKKAVAQARNNDKIILSPGTYIENDIIIDKKIVITSEWALDGDTSKIEKTVIDACDKNLFSITAAGVEISGLKIINGDHPLDINANATIKHNHFSNNKDAISFEGSGGGYAGYNTIENDRDDGIDLDIRKGEKNKGTDITIEYNTVINSIDDGIEIRLYDYPNQNISYSIHYNVISDSRNAGIQLISYDIFTGKEFHIHHNILKDCKVGLGCMEGTNTKENMGGASTLNEVIYFYNNTIINNQVGATGGNHVYAMNNIVMNNKLGGLKRFGKNSVVANNLFNQNGKNDFVDFNELVTHHSNRFDASPLISENTFEPLTGSPCINSGEKFLVLAGKRIIEIDPKSYSGNKPDIGAVEFKE